MTKLTAIKATESRSKGRRNTSRVTLEHVARRAGVHGTTASQVLNGRANCWASDATRQRIFDAARELGYRPNLSAQALRTGRSGIIGLISPGFGVRSQRSRPVGLTEAAASTSYAVTVSSHSNDSESEDILIRQLLDRGVDGLAVYPTDSGPHTELRRLAQTGFPVVTFEGANLLDFECDDVSTDLEKSGRSQARHLLRLGRRRVCFANGMPEARINAIRAEAVRRELQRAKAPPPLEMRIPISTTTEFTDADLMEKPMRAFIRKHLGEFDATIGTDFTASIAIRCLQAMGLRVPHDVAVMGCDDSILASHGSLPLTTPGTIGHLAGKEAFRLIMARIRGEAGPDYRRLMLSTRLVVRQSTRPKKA